MVLLELGPLVYLMATRLTGYLRASYATKVHPPPVDAQRGGAAEEQPRLDPEHGESLEP